MLLTTEYSVDLQVGLTAGNEDIFFFVTLLEMSHDQWRSQVS
jgi:hypothetical protein